jgi:hypothetical protein
MQCSLKSIAWMQELGELDRLMDENLEQVPEQRYLLASLDDGREADLIEKFLQDLLSTRQNLFCRSRELACGITALNLLRLRKPRLLTKISATNDLGSGLPEVWLFAAVCRHL